MGTAKRETITLTCPGCGGTFVVSSVLAGRRAKCSRCQAALEIPPPAAPAAEPDLIGVLCRTCETPLYGTVEQIGKELVCPDCRGRTVLTQPKPKRPNIPPAMEGEQYELWDVDEDPRFDKSSRKTAEHIPVTCWLCETLMYAQLDQIGSQLVCPDCGSSTTVEQPAEVKPKKGVMPPTGDEYQVAPATSRMAVPVLSEEEEKRIVARDEAGRGGSIHDDKKEVQARQARDLDIHGRPILPNFPTIQGVISFAFSSGVPARWGIFTSMFYLIAFGFLFAIASLGGGGAGPLAGVFMLAFLVIVVMITVVAFAAHFLAIVTESSEGSDRVYAWPTTNFADWLLEMGYCAMGLTIAAFPGWLLANWLTQDPGQQLLVTCGMTIVCFPIVLLSQLSSGSIASVFSPKIALSIGRQPGTWALFYIESVLMVVLCGAIWWAALEFHPSLLLLIPPVAVLAVLLYGRMLGRLAWSVAESTPALE